MEHKLKVCVYAISKNEEKNVVAWVNSMKEADAIYVLDTGSTDRTVDILRMKGVHVIQEIVKPWRFDVARNKSLELVPKDCDVCVCTDIDEIFNKGWRDELEKIWGKDVVQLHYKYTWHKDKNGNETVFYLNNIHARNGFKWEHPVHETINYIKQKSFPKILTDKIHLMHYPDLTKPRSNYLDLLKLAVTENPNNDRDVHYLGREYMYYEKWKDCIVTLKKHLNLPTATWNDERSASMRYIGNSYRKLEDNKQAESWYFKAIAEAPYLREPYISMADLYYEEKNWLGVLNMVEMALSINKKPTSYINEVKAWGPFPYDIGSIACFNIGLYKKAYDYCNKAIKLNPQNKRLNNNLKLIKKELFK